LKYFKQGFPLLARFQVFLCVYAENSLITVAELWENRNNDHNQTAKCLFIGLYCSHSMSNWSNIIITSCPLL